MKYETGWRRLFFTRSNDLDLSWVLTVLFSVVGLVGFLFEAIRHGASGAAWAWLGTTTALIILAAIPINKARLLKDATLPGQVGSVIGSVARSVKTEATEVSTTVATESPPTPPTEGP